MRRRFAPLLVVALSLYGRPTCVVDPDVGDWQITFSPISKLLDNNDNFSRDDRFLVFDTRDTVGGGIGNGTSIMKVNTLTGEESVIYAPQPVLIGAAGPAPGLGAASYSPLANEVVFIHGPLVSEVPTLGVYGARNRRGGVARDDGSNSIRFMDYRDITSDTTIPGAHRGGTHRHEYTIDGKRVGFTYDDQLLQTYGRTCGYMVEHPRAPSGVSHYAVLLVPVVPTDEAKTGDLVQASDDSWVGAQGLMRGFIGRVKEADGSIMSSLYVVDIPADVDITTADSGTKTRFPGPPRGTRIRRLTTTPAGGIVRGSHDGTRIGYFATADDGTRQMFIIASNGSDKDPNPALRPQQVTFLPGGAQQALRWHPSGNSVAVIADNGVLAICVKPGPLFGASHWLTPHGSSLTPLEALVWSRDGQRLAFNRRVPTFDSAGRLVKDFGGNDFRQIFLVNFPDCDNNGIVDAIEDGVVRNGASFVHNKVAPDAWASVTGPNLGTKTAAAPSSPLPTTLGGVSVEVTDVSGARRPGLLHYASPQQINFVLPGGTRSGKATVIVTLEGGQKLTLPAEIDGVAPGLFTVGSSIAAATALRIDAQGRQTAQAVYTCGTTTCSMSPLEVGSDPVYLLLYGTGLRGNTTPVTARVGGQTAEIVGFGPSGEYVGLDQINVRIPPALAGKGEVFVEVTVDGRKSNVAKVWIR